mgnify:FL=1
MCGIVGYLGYRNAQDVIVSSLQKLEYRGYDSCGLAILNSENKIEYMKTAGKINDLKEMLIEYRIPGNFGIGHTRWATHGKPDDRNAHPHSDGDSSVWIVHNGIVENYQELKTELEYKGYKFKSETDSEIIAFLISDLLKQEYSFIESVEKTAEVITGSHSVLAMADKDMRKVIGFRKGHAGGLVVGYGNDEMFIASDMSAIGEYTNKLVYLESDQLVILDDNSASYKDIGGGYFEPDHSFIEVPDTHFSKDDFDHYMIKEIIEQPRSIYNSLSNKIIFNDDKIEFEDFILPNDFTKDINRIILTGMGTSLYACEVGQYFIESLANIPCQTEDASELRYKDSPIDENTLLISVTQSGETADTLGAMSLFQTKGCKQILISNSVGSAASRIADIEININSGIEIGVASTKSFTGSILSLLFLAIKLGTDKSTLSIPEAESLILDSTKLPDLMNQVVEMNPQIEMMAKKYSKYNHFLYLGRGFNKPVAFEGALKLKEVSYIHAEGYSAGQMKHGPIALVDNNIPVIAMALTDSYYEKMRNTIQEIKARSGILIGLVTKGNYDLDGLIDDVIEIPECPKYLTPFLTIIPLQLFSYYIALELGYDVDQPRNLAKTVTVE